MTATPGTFNGVYGTLTLNAERQLHLHALRLDPVAGARPERDRTASPTPSRTAASATPARSPSPSPASTTRRSPIPTSPRPARMRRSRSTCSPTTPTSTTARCSPSPRPRRRPARAAPRWSPTRSCSTPAPISIISTPARPRKVVVSYTISDEHGATSSSTVTITVNGANDAPVANDDTASTTEDASVSGNVLANDTDVDVETLTVANPGHLCRRLRNARSSPPTAATPTRPTRRRRALDDGETAQDVFAYTASDGTASDTATLTVTVNGANDAPVANDDTASTNEDSAGVSGNVLANDTDVDGEPLTVANPGTYVGTYGTLTHRRRRQLHLHARRGGAGARRRRDGAGRLHLHRLRRHRLRHGDAHRHGHRAQRRPGRQ